MKTKKISIFTFIFTIGILVLLNSCSTNKDWLLQPTYEGHWESQSTKITVRTEPKWMKFIFTTDTAKIILDITTDKTTYGKIGTAEFKGGIITLNGGNPERTGVMYIVKCGQIGKIFPSDPISRKEVELWLSLVKGCMEASLRYTEGGSVFPMARVKFYKK